MKHQSTTLLRTLRLNDELPTRFVPVNGNTNESSIKLLPNNWLSSTLFWNSRHLAILPTLTTYFCQRLTHLRTQFHLFLLLQPPHRVINGPSHITRQFEPLA